jgi:hypothetical protein
MSARKVSPHLEADRLLAVQVAYEVAGPLRARMTITPNNIFRETRGDALESLARQIVAWILVKVFDLSLQRAGDAMGRHRTTLTNAIDVITGLAVNDDTDGFSEFLEELGKKARRGIELGNLFAACELATAPEDVAA